MLLENDAEVGIQGDKQLIGGESSARRLTPEQTKEQMTRKVLFGGGYYQYSLLDLEWERTTNQTEDFLTLIRQTVYVILGFQGIITREFISHDGFFIVTVCYGHEFNTKMVVEYLRMKKFLDVAFIDLMGLEPLDDKRRPLRLHESIQDIKAWEYHYGPDHVELFREINAVTRRINFQKMVREFRGIWGKDMVREENAKYQIYSHAKVSVSTWENYLVYLQNLAEKVSELRVGYRTDYFKLKAKFLAKFEGFSDLGVMVKEMVMKTSHEDHFRLNNMRAYLEDKKKSRRPE